MEVVNVLKPKSRNEFRKWLKENFETQNECYVPLIKKEPKDDGKLYYIDAVYEALSFGWIDNRQIVIDGIRYIRISKRVKNSSFNELNKERCRLLIKEGLMETGGYQVIPNLNDSFVIPNEIVEELKREGVYERFINYPSLYQRIRISYITGFKNKDDYNKALNHLILMTKKNKLYGEWNDYGRLN